MSKTQYTGMDGEYLWDIFVEIHYSANVLFGEQAHKKTVGDINCVCPRVGSTCSQGRFGCQGGPGWYKVKEEAVQSYISWLLESDRSHRGYDVKFHLTQSETMLSPKSKIFNTDALKSVQLDFPSVVQ